MDDGKQLLDIERLSVLDHERMNLRQALSTLKTIKSSDPGILDAAMDILQREIDRVETSIKDVESHMTPDIS